MYLEAEVYWLLVVGFASVAVVSAAVLLGLYFKSRNKHLIWFGGQLVFLSAAFYYFFQCVSYLPHEGNAMYSEDQSVTLAMAGICWAVSMLFALIGVYKMLRKSDVVYQF